MINYVLIQAKGILKIGGEFHAILEVEFYFNNDNHRDPYTHCNPGQNRKGYWYFHVNKTKSGEFVYREKRFAGLDISIGDQKGGSGGILIRSIYCHENDTVYCGPGQVMEYIVTKSGCETVSEMVTKNFKDEESL